MFNTCLKTCCLAVILSLSGCTVTTYTVPETSPKANLTIKTLEKTPGNLWIYNYEGNMVGYECSSTPVIPVANLNNVSLVNAHADKGKHVQSVTLPIAANKPFRIQMIYPFPSGLNGVDLELRFCTAHVSFQPKAGANYKIVHGIGGNVCNMDVFEIGEHGVETPTAHQKLPMCYDADFMRHLHAPILQNYKDNPHLYDQKN